MTNVRRFAAIFVFSILVCVCISNAQNVPASAASVRYTTAGIGSDPSLSSYSTGYRPLNLVGTYRPDGSFRPVLNQTDARLQLVASSKPESPDQSAVPSRFLTSSNESVVENMIPPYRANQRTQGRSAFALLRDNIIAVAYGHPRVLSMPTHVVTDSRGRLIVADPQLVAVHVIETGAKRSFRISGGPMRRLQAPVAVAVDARDNIYVADSKLGLVSVYDPGGRFLRYLGDVQGESMFDSPAAIAIDRKSGRLYVLDAAASELIVLDLQGKVLKRVGGERSQTAVRLQHPSEIAIARDEVVVLDRFGSRIQVLDLDCQPKAAFPVRSPNGAPITGEVGLALDSHRQIYISNLLSSAVRVYSHDGEFLGYLGRSMSEQKFNQPLGMWVDPMDRLYVSESNSGKIQVFQLASGEAATPAIR